MILHHFADLVFKHLEKSKKTAREIAKPLGVTRQNIAMWKAKGVIPDRHVKVLIKELNIPKVAGMRALTKDIQENFK